MATDLSMSLPLAHPGMAISVAQPWAWALIHGPKRIENRSWRPSYRGQLVIHASKRLDYLHRYRQGKPAKQLQDLPADADLAYGALIGMVNLRAVFSLEDGKRLDAEFATGPFCWFCASPRAFLRPIRWRGERGLFDIPAIVIETAINTEAA